VKKSGYVFSGAIHSLRKLVSPLWSKHHGKNYHTCEYKRVCSK